MFRDVNGTIHLFYGHKKKRTMNWLYLVINAGAFFLPLVFSFHQRIRFSKKFAAAGLAITAVSVPFIIWDVMFTRRGIWGFNDSYHLGSTMWGLPAEEIIFFFFIPFSCLFTYYVFDLNYRTRVVRFTAAAVVLCIVFSVLCLCLVFIYHEKNYSSLSFFAGSVTLVLLAIIRPGFLVTALLSFVILLVPFFIVNGVLTGMFTPEPVVWYNQDAISGLRVVTIPVEDFVYALVLIIANITLFDWLDRMAASRTSKM